jgi:hypothetical protein
MDRPTFEDFACMARQLVQVTLPHRNPGDVPEWSRTNGNLLLSIRPGWTTDAKTGQRRPTATLMAAFRGCCCSG